MDKVDPTARTKLLAQYVQVRREELGLTVRALAAKAGVSHGAVGNLLAGEVIPRAETLKAIAEALQIDEAHLMYLAGYLEGAPDVATDPEVMVLLRRLEELTPNERANLLRAFQAMLDAIKPREPRED